MGKSLVWIQKKFLIEVKVRPLCVRKLVHSQMLALFPLVETELRVTNKCSRKLYISKRNTTPTYLII